MSRTCRIDLEELTKSIQEFDKQNQTALSRDPLSFERPKNLVDLFGDEVRSLRFKNARVTEITVTLLEKLNLPKSCSHIMRAGERIGEKVDASIHDLPSYHNQYHVAEVVMATYILAKREHLSNARIGEIVVAAAAHDLGHPGGNNTTPFEIETLSSKIAEPILRKCAWNEEHLFRFRKMLLATDFVNGVPGARNDYRKTHALPEENEERILAAQCLLLTEADVLFSCFTTEYNEELSKLLSQEWNLPTSNLTVKQRLGFLNSVTFISDAALQLGIENRRLALVADLQNALTAQV